MSHAVVFVVSEEKPTLDVLEDILLPWHEYESTGIEEYIEEVDITEEVINEWEKGKTNAYRYEDGSYGYSEEKSVTKEKYEVLFKQIFPSILEFVEEYYGCKHRMLPNGSMSFYRLTNPNAKWDWWTIGGRWRGYFKVKDIQKDHGIGDLDLLGYKKVEVGFADIIQKSNIDWDYKKNKLREEFSKLYDDFISAVNGRELPDFDKLLETHPIEEARKIFWADEVVKDVQNIIPYRENPKTLFDNGKEAFVEKWVNKNTIPLSLVYKGEWIEHGQLGWWGFIDENVSEKEWVEKFQKIWDEIPNDYWVTVIDYHI